MNTEAKILTNAQIFDCFDCQCTEIVINFDADELYPVGRAIEQAVLQSPEIQKLREDAELYRTLRGMWWNDSPLCVVSNPKNSVRPGSDCPSGERLDLAIRSVMKEPETGDAQ